MARRAAPEINAGSMADIAFLLLIFFLVTTTMDVDSGISRKLPPYDEREPPEQPPIKERNILRVLVNSQDLLLVDDQYMDLGDLKDYAKRHISNFGREENLSESPEKHVISLQNDRGTSYEMYIAVQNELTAAYNELRDEESMKRFGRKFNLLNEAQAKEVADYYPMKISEAEPVKLK
ncbi:MAG: ExbD/TolR family protein [Thermaurantimonas sp.]